MTCPETPLIAPFNLLADVLAGAGAGILAYRGYLGSRTELRLRAPDVAALASRGTGTHEGDSLAQAFGEIVEVFEFDTAHGLLRQRVDAWLGWLFLISGAILPLVSLIVRRVAARFEVVAVGFGLGVVFAWMVAEVSRFIWRRVREETGVAHAWLTWLERMAPDPLKQSLNQSQDLLYIIWASPHPDLQRFVKRTGKKGAALNDYRDVIYRWVADLAVRLKHRFDSEEWREWVSQMRTR